MTTANSPFRLATLYRLLWMRLKTVSVKPVCPVRRLSVLNPGKVWKLPSHPKKSLRVLSPVRSRAALPLTLTPSVRSCRALWLTCVRFAILRTWKAKSWTSKSSSWIRNATTLLFLAVPFWKLKTPLSVSSCWKLYRKVSKSRALSRT